jgi:hypothetical protein
MRKNNASNLLCVFYALTDDDVTFVVLLHVITCQTVLAGSYFLIEESVKKYEINEDGR